MGTCLGTNHTDHQLVSSVANDPDGLYVFVQPGAGTPTDDVRRIPIVVPAATRYLRVALSGQASSPDADLDLYLYHCPGYDTCTWITGYSTWGRGATGRKW